MGSRRAARARKSAAGKSAAGKTGDRPDKKIPSIEFAETSQIVNTMDQYVIDKIW